MDIEDGLHPYGRGKLAESLAPSREAQTKRATKALFAGKSPQVSQCSWLPSRKTKIFGLAPTLYGCTIPTNIQCIWRKR
jgi:hypothetical protein